MKFKNISRACLIHYFLCIVALATYIFVKNDFTALMPLGITSLVLFATFVTFASLKPTRRYIPYTYSAIFVANCFVAALGTPVGSHLPIVFITASIIIGFFTKPQSNLFFLALSDIAILTLIFLDNASAIIVPLPTFIAFFVIYNIAIICLVILTFNFKRTLNATRINISRLSKIVHRQDLFISGVAQNVNDSLKKSDDLCSETLRISSDESQKETVSQIKNINKQIHSVMTSTDDYVNLERRKLRIEKEIYTFSSFLNDLVSLCAAKIDNTKTVDFLVNVDEKIPSALVGDYRKITQAVLNVFANAAQYTRFGSITLSIGTRKTDYGVNLNIEVSDTGVGIKPHIADKIFTAYTDSKNAIHLGLGISKQLVSLMGGFISLSTEQNAGTTIKMSIPQGVNNAEPFVYINTKKVTVLMLIEGKHLKNYMDKLFTQAGTELVFCENNAEFMVEKERKSITHVITDYGSYIYHKPYFDLLSQRASLYVIKEPNRKEDSLPREVKRLYYPLHLFSLCLMLGTKPRKPVKYHFTAPEAKVLVVDDNPLNVRLVSSFLSAYKLRLSSAANGYEAIETAKSEHFDLIILDHLMPGMKGTQAAEMIRKDGLCTQTPILAFTVDVGEPTDTELMAAGINDMLSKPPEPAQIDELLQKWLPPRLIKHDRQAPASITDSYLDVSEGLKGFPDQKSYLNALESFYNNMKSVESALLKSLYENDSKGYSQICSSIRESAEKICAQSIAEQTRLLEFTATGTSSSSLEEQHKLLITLYSKTNACIEDYFNEKNVVLHRLISLSDALPGIIQAINRKDAQTSYELIRQLLGYSLAPSVRGLLEKAIDAIDGFEFELAYNVISELKNVSDENGKGA